MVQVTFIEADGTRRAIEAPVGEPLMYPARNAGVRGIIAECGGSAMCATCHCYLVAGALPEAEALEAETLEIVAQNVQASSRLTCQITVTDAMAGIVVQVAAR